MPPLTDADLARIEAQVWVDGRGADDDRSVLLDEVKRLRARAAEQRKAVQRLTVVVARLRARLSDGVAYQKTLEERLRGTKAP